MGYDENETENQTKMKTRSESGISILNTKYVRVQWWLYSSNTWATLEAQFTKKLSNTEAESKKGVAFLAYKNAWIQLWIPCHSVLIHNVNFYVFKSKFRFSSLDHSASFKFEFRSKSFMTLITNNDDELIFQEKSLTKNFWRLWWGIIMLFVKQSRVRTYFNMQESLSFLFKHSPCPIGMKSIWSAVSSVSGQLSWRFFQGYPKRMFFIEEIFLDKYTSNLLFTSIFWRLYSLQYPGLYDYFEKLVS